MIEARLALAQAVGTLSDAGVDSPRLDAELLLTHVLQTNRANVLAWPDRCLTPRQLTAYRYLIERRAAREPLAYILGRREFFGLDFLVDARVLIPRPETEFLVEEALRLAKTRHSPLLADVGAGSGAIAVSLAVHLPQATVYALDDSPEALAVAAQNARRHGVAGRIRCLEGNLLAPLPRPVDFITANLPYVATPEWADLAPEIRQYEPRTALDGGPDGLVLIRGLLAEAAPYLRFRSALLLEIGAGQGQAVTTLAERLCPGAEIRLHQDYAGLDRLLVVQV
jgi:release factor glutamine methyltransferase